MDSVQSPNPAAFNTLVNFDWSLKMALSSDKVSGLRKPLLMVKLETADPSKETKETLVEFDADELAAFIKQLKAAQKIARL